MQQEYEKDPGWQYLRQSAEQRLADQTRPYDSKKNIWVPDPEEGYIAAEIKSTKGDMVTAVNAKGSEVTIKKDMVQEMNPPKFTKTEDMSNLSFLNDASVLGNLRDRYASMLIYTYSGLFCVVINPYKRLPIYTDSVGKIFMGKRRNEIPPHLFAVSDEAYRNMLQDRENQSMLITGESGAGKTENTKKVIAYFAIVGSTMAAASGKVDDGKKKVSLEEQIVQTNPVLEAFGNAKTVRNNNSSRFGKFIRIHFSKDGRVAGCDIEHYLLEKSRVIRQAPGERCYHIFYQIYSNKDLRDKLKLKEELKFYHFVSQAELTIAGVDDVEEYNMTNEAFDILNFNAEEKLNCYKCMSAHMHLGEMKFKQKPRDEQAEPDGTDEAALMCEMMGIDTEAFLTALTKPRVRVGSEWVNKGQNVEQVHWAIETQETDKTSFNTKDKLKARIAAEFYNLKRETFHKSCSRFRNRLEAVIEANGAIAKACYARIFHWLVEKCNLTLDAQELERKSFIGVLDIAGFEIFDMNSFEQLWINFVNEKLQQFFNHHMFVLEQVARDFPVSRRLLGKPLPSFQEEYAREGIKWTFIDFGLDLAACIELIEKPLGIISMLDEECIVPKATDMTLASKLCDQHLGKHPNFEKPKPPKGKQSEAHFAMKHYAGTVRYNVLNWLEKNKDPLNDSAVSVMKTSIENELLVHIWGDYQTQEEAAKLAKETGGKGGGGKKKGKSASMMTVSMLYRESLNKLMTMLNSTHPHFVRCIIPNEKKQSGVLDAALVMNQLTCNGVLEGIRICRKGFPNRTLHTDFKTRYSVLAADAAKASEDAKVCAEGILAQIVTEGGLTEEMFRVGETKVFFKAGTLAHLEDLRDEKLSAIMIGLQSAIRWYVGVADVTKRKERLAGLKVLQRNIKSWFKLRTWEWFLLLGKVKPLVAAEHKEMHELQDKITATQEALAKEEANRKELEEIQAKLLEEKNAILEQLKLGKAGIQDQEDKIARMAGQKSEMEKVVSELTSKVSSSDDKAADQTRQKRKVDQEKEGFSRQIQDLELSLNKIETEKQSRDHQITSLQEEMQQQDEVIAKLNKDKKNNDDNNRKVTEEFHAEEDKVNHLNKVKGKLENNLDEMEENLERERRLRQDIEKQKRKFEGDCKVYLENIDEISRLKYDIEQSLKRKENELHDMASKYEDETSQLSKLQKQVKELQARNHEAEEELEIERSSRSKADRARTELQRELEDLAERLDEQGGATSASVEINKKREQELNKLRRDLEESNLNHENHLAALRKKHNDAVGEMGDQLDQLTKTKAKMDKEKNGLAQEIDSIQRSIDGEVKAKQNMDKNLKTLELQVNELQGKADDQVRQLADFQSLKSRLNNESSELARQVEEAESSISSLQRSKAQLTNQVEEAKRAAEDEARERQSLAAQAKNYQHECDMLREQMEEEGENKAEILRQQSKANAEILAWKSRFENEGLAKAEEVEEAKRQLQMKVNNLQETIDALNAKLGSSEKQRMKLIGELDDAQVDVERANTFASQLEKKQKGFDKVLDEWQKKADDVNHELEASQRDSRNLSTDLFKMKSQNDELAENVEGVRRENRNLMIEIKELTNQLGEGGRSVHEMQKMVRRLELEKEELQQALDEAEAALEAEESKVLRSQVEVSQIRSEIEKRIQEKEEEFENTRKNHQRALDSMQASLETETKGRTELLRVKKKLESDINELEIAMDHANKANMDAQRNIKKYVEQLRELQMQIEEEQRNREELREVYNGSEKRAAALMQEKEEASRNYEKAERALKSLEMEAFDAKVSAEEMSAEVSSLHGAKRKLETELQALHADLDETLTELKAQDERCKSAMADAARLAEELRQEQEHSLHAERMRKGMEVALKDMQVRLDEAEKAALQGGKKIIQKLETRIREIEQELDSEQRRHQESTKHASKAERSCRELQFQIDEDRKNAARLNDLAEKLQQKIKTYKRQVEEAEELANVNLQKYRQLQHQMEDAEERADTAENSLSKLRAKSRSGASLAPGGGGDGGLARSATSSGFLGRSSSRARMSSSNIGGLLDF